MTSRNFEIEKAKGPKPEKEYCDFNIAINNFEKNFNAQEMYSVMNFYC